MVIHSCCGSLFHAPRPACEKVLVHVQTSSSILIKALRKKGCQLRVVIKWEELLRWPLRYAENIRDWVLEDNWTNMERSSIDSKRADWICSWSPLLLRNSAAALCISWNILQDDGFMPRYSALMESRREAARAWITEARSLLNRMGNNCWSNYFLP